MEEENPKTSERNDTMKLFKAIVDDGESVFNAYGCAKNKKEFMRIYGGNGVFKIIEDVTKDYLTAGSLEVLKDSLSKTGWGIPEMTILCALLEEHLEKNKMIDVIGG